jgi:hypothetical protein
VTVPVDGAVHETSRLPETAGEARLALTLRGALSTIADTDAVAVSSPEYGPSYSTTYARPPDVSGIP